MNLTDALAKATANGWSDDSQFTRSTVETQVSTERDGFLAAITVYVNGTIRWGVQSLTGEARPQRGEATSLDAAITACDGTITTLRGTLF